MLPSIELERGQSGMSGAGLAGIGNQRAPGETQLENRSP